VRQPDMSRPVPAAPSPGSSAARAKLTAADRARISRGVAARFQGRKPKPERKGIMRRFSRGDEDWAYLQDGSLWCFRAGPFEYGCIVRPREGRHSNAVGVVTGIVPTWGDQVRIAVWFKAQKRVSYDREDGSVREYWTRPNPFWQRDQLEIIGYIDKEQKSG
jgi:hypothetical protein